MSGISSSFAPLGLIGARSPTVSRRAAAAVHQSATMAGKKSSTGVASAGIRRARAVRALVKPACAPRQPGRLAPCRAVTHAAGQLRDARGLCYMRARWYDPAVGRFLTRDPIAGRFEHQHHSMASARTHRQCPVGFGELVDLERTSGARLRTRRPTIWSQIFR